MSAHAHCAEISLSSPTGDESLPLQWWRKAAHALRPQPQHWQLPAGHAISLHVRHCAVLQIQVGTAWVTQRGVMPSGPATDSASLESGDLFLRAGQCLTVKAGQHLVLQGGNSDPTASQGLVSGVLVRAARPV